MPSGPIQTPHRSSGSWKKKSWIGIGTTGLKAPHEKKSSATTWASLNHALFAVKNYSVAHTSDDINTSSYDFSLTPCGCTARHGKAPSQA